MRRFGDLPAVIPPGVVARVMARVSMPEGIFGCWLCSLRGAGGYAAVTLDGNRSRVAHRVMFAAYKGPIPPRLVVMHSCDVRICVNPWHLSLGTDAENVADAAAKGRLRPATGEAHPSSKLTVEVVERIRSSSDPSSVWARRLGVTKTAIYSIRKGIVWKGVGGPAVPADLCERRLSEAEKREIRASSESNRLLALRLGRSVSAIKSVRKGRKYAPPLKLTPEAVRVIRSSEESETRLGRAFGVSGAMVGLVRRRQAYAGVPDVRPCSVIGVV